MMEIRETTKLFENLTKTFPSFLNRYISLKNIIVKILHSNARSAPLESLSAILTRFIKILSKYGTISLILFGIKLRFTKQHKIAIAQ